MSSSLGGSPISPTFGYLVVSVSYTRRNDLTNLKVDVMRGFFLGYASNSKIYRVFNKTSGQVEETCDAFLFVPQIKYLL
jgi:hypothetical protein